MGVIASEAKQSPEGAGIYQEIVSRGGVASLLAMTIVRFVSEW
jgi:hypothetical protein